MTNRTRCPWCENSDIERLYHDTEWGVPIYDDKKLFEFLTLEAAQAGLSWVTILKKRNGYREAFADFTPEKIIMFTEKNIEKLMLNPAIVRHKLKIESTISNARIFLEVSAKYGSFSKYIWRFVDGQPVQNQWTESLQVPATSTISDTIAKEFKRLGFKFLGSTTLYAYMQATGMVNDHLVSCFRYNEVVQKKDTATS